MLFNDGDEDNNCNNHDIYQNHKVFHLKVSNYFQRILYTAVML